MSTSAHRGPTRRPILIAAATCALVLVSIGVEYERTAAVRRSVRCCAALVAAANRGDLQAARLLCSARLLRSEPPRMAPGGGLVGLPRSFDRSYTVRQIGHEVLVAPTGRGGFVYRFIREGRAWKYDGAFFEARSPRSSSSPLALGDPAAVS